MNTLSLKIQLLIVPNLLDTSNPNIFFKIREISVISNIFNKVSNLKYITNYKEDTINSDILNIEHNSNNKILKFLRLLPLDSDFNQFGLNLGLTEVNGKNGNSYKLNHEISVFIYDINSNSHKGIVFKKNHEYFKFEDSIVNSSEFIRYF